MSSQANLADTFRSLHVAGRPLVLFNVWDPGSARAVASTGASALATGSWSVASAFGFEDGERLPLELGLGNLARIVQATTLPVSIDLESGYGDTPDAVADTIARALGAGAIGCNLEDSSPGNGHLRDPVAHAATIAAVRAATAGSGIAFFLNARTDVFLGKQSAEHDLALTEDALNRCHTYAEAGADGLFVPGLVDERLIAHVVERSPLPVNVMATEHTPSRARLAELGVARISHGPGPYRTAMAALEDAARAAMT